MKVFVEKMGHNKVACVVYFPGDEEEEPWIVLTTGEFDSREEMDGVLASLIDEEDEEGEEDSFQNSLSEVLEELDEFRKSCGVIVRENPSPPLNPKTEQVILDVSRFSVEQLRDLNKMVQDLLRKIGQKAHEEITK